MISSWGNIHKSDFIVPEDDDNIERHNVKIKKSKSNTYWYSNQIGKTFTVFEILESNHNFSETKVNKQYFVINEFGYYNGHMILKEDVV